jgi:hypothetical protein
MTYKWDTIHTLYFPEALNYKATVRSYLDLKKACKFLLKEMIDAHGENERTDKLISYVKSENISMMIFLYREMFGSNSVSYYITHSTENSWY